MNLGALVKKQRGAEHSEFAVRLLLQVARVARCRLHVRNKDVHAAVDEQRGCQYAYVPATYLPVLHTSKGGSTN